MTTNFSVKIIDKIGLFTFIRRSSWHSETIYDVHRRWSGYIMCKFGELWSSISGV